MVRAMMYAQAERVKGFTWFMLWDWRGTRNRDGHRSDPGHAIQYFDKSPRPAYVAFAVMTGVLDAADYVGPAQGLTGMQRGFEFRKGTRRIHVLWDYGEAQSQVALKDAAASATLVDIMGRRKTIEPMNGAFAVTLGPNPIYLIAPAEAIVAAAPAGVQTFDDDKPGAAPAKPWLANQNASVVQVADGNMALRLRSPNNRSTANARWPVGKVAKGATFVLQFDWRAEKSGQAGNLCKLASWNTNHAYLAINTAGGKNQFQLSDLGRAKPAHITPKVMYTPKRWYRFTIAGNTRSDTYRVKIIDRGPANDADVKTLFETPAAALPRVNKAHSKIVYFCAGTWPGQSKDGYAFDYDNVSFVTK